MDFRPMAPLVFTPEARRLLTLALLQADDERIVPAAGDQEVTTTLYVLSDLGLIEIASGGYVATELLRGQAWAIELTTNPFPD